MYQEYIDLAWCYVKTQITHNQFFSAAALSSVGLGALYYLKGIPMSIWRRIHRYVFFSMTIEQADELFNYIDAWVAVNMPKDLRRVEAFTRNGKVLTTHENDYTYFWKNWRRICISKTKTKLEAADGYSNMFNRTYTISGIMARKVITDLVQQILTEGLAAEEALKKTKKKIKVFTLGKYGYFDGNKSSNGKTFDKVYLKQKEQLIKDLEGFKSKEELYSKLGITFKRGFTFWGAPGTGKSSLAYAIAEYMKYDLYILDLSAVKPDDFVGTINGIPSGSVVLIEDIDNFYNKREPSKDNKVNFSTFLNCLSGVASKDHIITVITTNNLEKLDDALLRAGRSDVIMELKLTSKELAEQYLSDVFQTTVVLDSYKEKSFAALQEIVLTNINNLEQIKVELSC